MNSKFLPAAIFLVCLFGILRNASSDDNKPIRGSSTESLYLHLLGTHRAKHHDPEGWRSPSEDDRAPVWSCVASIRVYNEREFYIRAPGNRDPYVMLIGLVSKLPSSEYKIQLEYELDDSNLTYSDTGQYEAKLDHFIYVAGGIYWRAILSQNDDAYESFDSAQKYASQKAQTDG